MSAVPTTDELRAALDGLDGEPVAHQADVLEALHARLVAELDALVIPRAEARPRA